MNKQNEAQRLSKEWFQKITLLRRVELGGKMAAELRRLEAENARMRSELERPMSSESTLLVHDNARLRKELEALRGAVPAGWILVPVTPTNDMTSAMADALEDPNNERSSWDLAENMWWAMLTKVPTPPEKGQP